MNTSETETVLQYQLDRWGLFLTFRLAAAGRPFHRFLVPAMAGLLFLNSAVDGEYVHGVLWAAGVILLYWAATQVFFLIHVYAGGVQALLSPQRITLSDEHLLVSSELSTEKFKRPPRGSARLSGGAVIVKTEPVNRLVFVRRGFARQEDFDALRKWMGGAE